MRLNNLMLLLLLTATLSVRAQERYFTKTAKITLYSQAPLETIEAVNKTAGAVLELSSGVVQAAVLMRGFEFKKALMQEHFNENYVESDKYPKGVFKGTLVNNTAVDYTKDGTYTATVRGTLTLHGVSRHVETPVTLTVRGGRITATAAFTGLLSDYNISIPSLVKDKISNSVRVSLDAVLEPLN